MTRLELDPIRCTGHGLCAELLPEAVALDEWGFPLLARGALPAGLVRRARAAAAACPTRALRTPASTGRDATRAAATGHPLGS